jgi:hypothetical protein
VSSIDDKILRPCFLTVDMKLHMTQNASDPHLLRMSLKFFASTLLFIYHALTGCCQTEWQDHVERQARDYDGQTSDPTDF